MCASNQLVESGQVRLDMSRKSNPNPSCLDCTLLQPVILYKENTVISVGGDTSCEDFN